MTAGLRPAGVTAERIASAIASRPDKVAAILEDEERRGHVRREGDRWALVAGAFPADVLAALTSL
jgi:hypothetical protein